MVPRAGPAGAGSKRFRNPARHPKRRCASTSTVPASWARETTTTVTPRMAACRWLHTPMTMACLSPTAYSPFNPLSCRARTTVLCTYVLHSSCAGLLQCSVLPVVAPLQRRHFSAVREQNVERLVVACLKSCPAKIAFWTGFFLQAENGTAKAVVVPHRWPICSH